VLRGHFDLCNAKGLLLPFLCLPPLTMIAELKDCWEKDTGDFSFYNFLITIQSKNACF